MTDQSVPDTSFANPSLEVQENEMSQGLFKRGHNWLQSTVGLAVMGVEVTPLNESLRYSTFVGVLEATDNRLAGSFALAGANLLIEGTASFAGANWLTRQRDKKTTHIVEEDKDESFSQRLKSLFNRKLDRILPKEKELPMASQMAVAYLGGAAVAQAFKIRQNPRITENNLRKYGLKMSTYMSGVVGMQGYVMGEAFISPRIETISAAVGAFIGAPILAGICKKIKL